MGDIFSIGRYEHNKPYRHVFYIPSKLYKKLINPKPAYIWGGRGSGKTSLLKILSWRERLNNKTLIDCFQDKPFKDKVIGIYLKLPDFELPSFEKWLSEFEEDQAIKIFSVYFDLLWIPDFLHALAELIANGEIENSFSDEAKAVDLLQNNSSIRFLGICKNDTFQTIGEKVKLLRLKLIQMAVIRASLSDFNKVFELGKTAALGKAFSGVLTDDEGLKNTDEWTMKICFDESETLPSRLQKFVNTFIRDANAPLSYVFSYVSKDRDLTETIHENLSVNLSDCEPLDLDQEDGDFKELIEGVANSRAKWNIPGWDGDIKLVDIFGDPSINEILEKQLTGSVAQKAQLLLSRAAKNKEVPYFESKGDSLPIYQTYLIDNGIAEISNKYQEYWMERGVDSQVRKVAVAAYLSICNDLKMDPIYAGYNAAIGIADNSVRDMLLQIDELYTQSGSSICELLTAKTKYNLQDKALKKASARKVDSLPQWARSGHDNINKYISTLGFLTHILQSRSHSKVHLRSSERGVFSIDKAIYNHDSFSAHRVYLEEAIYAGYLIVTDEKKDKKQIRLHRTLSPYYKFSYRGPYYPVNLEYIDFTNILKASNPTSFKKLALQIASRIDGGNSEQLSLF